MKTKDVILYFRDRMKAAGYDSRLGYNVPDFARDNKSKLSVELWLSDGTAQTWENTETPLENTALIECYVFRSRVDADNEGQWYEDVQNTLNELLRNNPDRPYSDEVWWDNMTHNIDYVSPLKRWNNALEYAPNFLVARIDLNINYLPR